MHDFFSMHVQEALNNRCECIHDFFFSEVQHPKRPFSVLDLDL